MREVREGSRRGRLGCVRWTGGAASEGGGAEARGPRPWPWSWRGRACSRSRTRSSGQRSRRGRSRRRMPRRRIRGGRPPRQRTVNAAVTTTLQRGFMRSKGTDSFPRDQEARFTAQDARERERGEREGAATAAAAGSRLGDDGGTRGARLFACLVVLCGLVLAHGECSAGRPRVASAVQARASCPEIFSLGARARISCHNAQEAHRGRDGG